MVYGCLGEGMEVGEWWKDGLESCNKETLFVWMMADCVGEWLGLNEGCGFGIYLRERMLRFIT